eukprot:215083_1
MEKSTLVPNVGSGDAYPPVQLIPHHILSQVPSLSLLPIPPVDSNLLSTFGGQDDIVSRKRPREEDTKALNQIQSQGSQSLSTVHFNVGGRKFEIEIETLKQLPSTVLGTLAANGFLTSMREKGQPVWIDRDPDAFALILNYYRTGKLSPTANVSRTSLLEEAEYFKIPIRAGDFQSDEELYWVRVAKTIKKNIRNEVLQSILVSMAFERDPRLKFFFDIEDRMKLKTSCLDAAHIVCPYCNKDVFYHTSEWTCPVRRHPGIWNKESQKWECCGVGNVDLDGCAYVSHYRLLSFDR